MNSWTIYWILQLDSIGTAFGMLFWALMAAALVMSVWNGISRLDTDCYPSLCDKDERKAAWSARAETRKKALLLAAPVFLIATFLPSTKTAAAMVIVPAIVNNETLQREAGDLYQLAKQALREAVGSDEKKPAK